MVWRRLLNTGYVVISGFTPAALQWLMMALVARTEGSERLGELAFLQALSVPAGYFAWMSLRQQALTARAVNYPDADFLFLRIFAPLIVYATILLGVFIVYPSTEMRLLALAVFSLRFAEGLFDIAYGFMQRDKRMGAIGSWSIVRFVVSTAVFYGLYHTTHLLWLSVGALAVLWVGSLAIQELFGFSTSSQNLKSVWSFSRDLLKRRGSLLLLSAPMAVSSVVMSLNANVPRYFLEGAVGTSELGLYAATFHFVAVGGIVVSSIGQAMLPHLATSAKEGRLRGFTLEVGGITIGILVMSLIAAAAVPLFGATVMALIYGPAFARYQEPLMAAALVAGPFYCASFLASAAFAVGMSKRMIVCYAAGLAATTLTAALTTGLGVFSAYWAVGVGAGTQMIVFTVMLIWFWRHRKEAAPDPVKSAETVSV